MKCGWSHLHRNERHSGDSQTMAYMRFAGSSYGNETPICVGCWDYIHKYLISPAVPWSYEVVRFLIRPEPLNLREALFGKEERE